MQAKRESERSPKRAFVWPATMPAFACEKMVEVGGRGAKQKRVYSKEWLSKAFSESRSIFGPLIPQLLPSLLVPAFLFLEFGIGGLTRLSALVESGTLPY
jgi:hypothetical protein